jgi:hypothetical protein
MYIVSPKTRRRIFLDNNISSYEERLKKVKELVFIDEILDYCYENRMLKSKRQEQSYLRAQRILENVATYLLMGQFKENNIMTLNKIRKTNQMEIPESCSNSNAVDLMYGADYGVKLGKGNFNQEASPELSPQSDFKKDLLSMSVQEIHQSEQKKKKQTLRYRQSKSYRMERLFSTPPVKTYRLKPVKVVGEDGKKRIAKNIFGQPIVTYEKVTIGGHVGLIDRSKPFIGKWCIVDTDNVFEFNGQKFQIDKSLEQYKVGKDNRCEMDKVLAYYIPHEDKYYFFDCNIIPIDESVKRI